MDFLFESDHFMTPDGLFCAQMRVKLVVKTDKIATPKGIQEVTGFDLKIYDEDNRKARKLSDFPAEEQNKIQEEAQKLFEMYTEECA
jgi:hypothetical protein